MRLFEDSKGRDFSITNRDTSSASGFWSDACALVSYRTSLSLVHGEKVRFDLVALDLFWRLSWPDAPFVGLIWLIWLNDVKAYRDYYLESPIARCLIMGFRSSNQCPIVVGKKKKEKVSMAWHACGLTPAIP